MSLKTEPLEKSIQGEDIEKLCSVDMPTGKTEFLACDYSVGELVPGSGYCARWLGGMAAWDA